jgi:hypothetical protein
MNKSHITDEQVDAFRLAISKTNNWLPSINDVHAALEAAFPEPQPAAFGPLVVTEEMFKQLGEEIDELYTDDNTLAEARVLAMQLFVDRHAIKPIAFADRIPEERQFIYMYTPNCKYWTHTVWFKDTMPYCEYWTHWLPASALPIPDPVVDPMEAAWNLYRVSNEVPNGATLAKQDFIAGYEAGQTEGAK